MGQSVTGSECVLPPFHIQQKCRRNNIQADYDITLLVGSASRVYALIIRTITNIIIMTVISVLKIHDYYQKSNVISNHLPS